MSENVRRKMVHEKQPQSYRNEAQRKGRDAELRPECRSTDKGERLMLMMVPV
ncbi:hypothetical protein FHW37_107265 [Neorhizobium alkalisoli]|uniref:Uncharacterized protein n=1 Tax=Neorhizobium alkalisoli TaxID=528178 RepID=A0A561QHQ4_9HYPH|nr:hypothetical protein FHW37_107265 [Neorhizobium alkalisoli]